MPDHEELLQTMDAIIKQSKGLYADAGFPDTYRSYLSRFLVYAERLVRLIEASSEDAAHKPHYSSDMKTCIGPIMGIPELILYKAASGSDPSLSSIHQQSVEIIYELTYRMLRIINETY